MSDARDPDPTKPSSDETPDALVAAPGADPWAGPSTTKTGLSRFFTGFGIGCASIGAVIVTGMIAEFVIEGRLGWSVVLIVPGLFASITLGTIASLFGARPARTRHGDDAEPPMRNGKAAIFGFAMTWPLAGLAVGTAAPLGAVAELWLWVLLWFLCAALVIDRNVPSGSRERVGLWTLAWALAELAYAAAFNR